VLRQIAGIAGSEHPRQDLFGLVVLDDFGVHLADGVFRDLKDLARAGVHLNDVALAPDEDETRVETFYGVGELFSLFEQLPEELSARDDGRGVPRQPLQQADVFFDELAGVALIEDAYHADTSPVHKPVIVIAPFDDERNDYAVSDSEAFHDRFYRARI